MALFINCPCLPRFYIGSCTLIMTSGSDNVSDDVSERVIAGDYTVHERGKMLVDLVNSMGALSYNKKVTR